MIISRLSDNINALRDARMEVLEVLAEMKQVAHVNEVLSLARDLRDWENDNE